MMQYPRQGSATFGDVYPGLGPTSTQMGSAGPALAGSVLAAAQATPPAAPQQAVAYAFLATPAGVLALIVIALVVFSLTDF
jgi:hypothetical protein